MQIIYRDSYTNKFSKNFNFDIHDCLYNEINHYEFSDFIIKDYFSLCFSKDSLRAAKTDIDRYVAAVLGEYFERCFYYHTSFYLTVPFYFVEQIMCLTCQEFAQASHNLGIYYLEK